MGYYFSKTLNTTFGGALKKVKEGLKKEGFGILTEIDVKATLKEKLDIGFRNYTILGACNPPFAYKALTIDDKIGAMLPCNVIVQETAKGKVEVASINPLSSIKATGNPKLKKVAEKVSIKLKTAIEGLS